MANHELAGEGAPASTPERLSQHYTDTLTGEAYLSVGTASAADWQLLADGGALGTIASQDADAVAITGGSITNLTTLEMPVSATPTVASDGEIAGDTTVTDFTTGVVKFYLNEEQAVVAMPIAQFTAPTDGYVVAYDATADEFQLKAPSGGGSSTAGKHAIWIAAGSITPSASGGCAALATIASAANQPDIQTLDFDATTQEYAQFSIRMPKSWNEGTVTFSPVWSHAATATNFGVVWDLQAVAVSDDDAIAAAFGTAQTSTDTGGTTNDLYAGPESSAITIAGTPAAEDVVFFRVSRVTGNGSDTMAIDARLHGITLYITTDAENDA